MECTETPSALAPLDGSDDWRDMAWSFHSPLLEVRPVSYLSIPVDIQPEMQKKRKQCVLSTPGVGDRISGEREREQHKRWPPAHIF